MSLTRQQPLIPYLILWKGGPSLLKYIVKRLFAMVLTLFIIIDGAPGIERHGLTKVEGQKVLDEDEVLFSQGFVQMVLWLLPERYHCRLIDLGNVSIRYKANKGLFRNSPLFPILSMLSITVRGSLSLMMVKTGRLG